MTGSSPPPANPLALVPWTLPTIGEEEIAEVVDTLRSGWLTTGRKVERFEEAVGALVGAEAALATSSCTAALHLALLTLGVGPGDEVVTTGMTFVATVNVIEQTGATPVLVDVEPDTLNIDPDLVAAAITPRTRAIVPVDFVGHPCEIAALRAVADAHGVAIVEDAAPALGATYGGVPVGGSGHLAAFSFYANKHLTTGEGGMLVGPAEQVERARVMGLHGIDRSVWERRGSERVAWYDVVYPGLKYNMTDIAASLGLSQLAKLESFLARRAEIAERYTTAFAAVPALEPPTVRPDVRPTWHAYVPRLELDRISVDRDQFLRRLAERGIGTSVHFRAVQTHSYYAPRFDASSSPHTLRESERVLSLPIYPALDDETVERVIDVVATTAAEVASA